MRKLDEQSKRLLSLSSPQTIIGQSAHPTLSLFDFVTRSLLGVTIKAENYIIWRSCHSFAALGDGD
jgi:hypothetical protein